MNCMACRPSCVLCGSAGFWREVWTSPKLGTGLEQLRNVRRCDGAKGPVRQAVFTRPLRPARAARELELIIGIQLETPLVLGPHAQNFTASMLCLRGTLAGKVPRIAPPAGIRWMDIPYRWRKALRQSSSDWREERPTTEGPTTQSLSKTCVLWTLLSCRVASKEN